VSTVDEIRISPAGEGFYAASSEATHTTPNKQSATAFSASRGGYSWAP
jgi:hypothetical protein